jgi:hypothetical protein
VSPVDGTPRAIERAWPGRPSEHAAASRHTRRPGPLFGIVSATPRPANATPPRSRPCRSTARPRHSRSAVDGALHAGVAQRRRSCPKIGRATSWASARPRICGPPSRRASTCSTA